LFALIGLSDEAGDEEFAPNYGESWNKVLQRYTSGLIKRGHGMDIVSYAGLGRQADGCPSWVPDLMNSFSERTEPKPLRWMSLYTAAGESEPEFKLSEDSSQLTVKGAIVDRLNFVGRDPSELMAASCSSLTILSWLGYAIATFLIHSSCPDGEASEEVMWRLFIANRTADMKIAPASLGDEFQKWKQYMFNGAWAQLDNTQDRIQIFNNMPGAQYAAAFFATFPFYRLCSTLGGRVGLVPLNADIGDFVVILNGGNAPFILRWVGRDTNTARLVGESYIHGIMNGEWMEDNKERKEFDIIVL
jgi:hypothetical protein